MTAPARSTVAVGAILACTLGLFAGALAWTRALAGTGLFDLGYDVIPLICTIFSASTVGAILAVRRPTHPVGWLFLALGASIATSAVVDGYAIYGAVAHPGSLPGADLVAVLGDGMFIVWFGLVGWILSLTPSGTTLSPAWRRAAWVWTGALALWYLTALVWPHHLDPPMDPVRSPWALDGAAPVLEPLRAGLGIVAGMGLILCAVSLLVRFRRARGADRQQLLWLAVVVVPLPAFVVLAYLSSPDHPLLLSIAMGGFMGTLPVAAGLSIVRYHLYDVDRILSRAVTWLLVSGVLAATFATVVFAAGRFIGERGDGSSIPAVLGTLAAAALAAPAYHAFQDALDQRFNRRRYDALQRVRAHLHDPDPTATIETVLAQALQDPQARVLFWVEDREQWVDGAGRPSTPEDGDHVATRQGRPVARVRASRDVDPGLLSAVTDEALPELENAMLRARISHQLAEVNDSRARIASAGLAERRRLERDLHDGAQQRLLALALELRAAEVNGSPDRLREAVAAGIAQLQAAVVELRGLANGLHPALLQGGGLAVALDDLASRLPVRLALHGAERRLAPEVEACAWFVACEAVTNAVKHAEAEHIDLELESVNGTVRIRVTDDGRGGADPSGSGLRGIADRVEALGGSLDVRSADTGTTVVGVLPCAP